MASSPILSFHERKASGFPAKLLSYRLSLWRSFWPGQSLPVFREKIWPKLLELSAEASCILLRDNGRPAIDPVLLCGVTLLQFMEKVADRGASEHVVYHLGWKYALDLELDYEGFHSTVLVYFRDRLGRQTSERMIFDGIVKLLVELGLVKKKGKQRLDSTHIVGYVKAMSWLECAMETLRLGLEDLEAEVGRKKRPEFWERLWEFYVQSKLDWRLSKTEHEKPPSAMRAGHERAARVDRQK